MINPAEEFEEIAFSSSSAKNRKEDQLLSDAILQNLNVRKTSDLNATFSGMSLSDVLTNDEIIQKLKSELKEADHSREFFLVFISERFGKMPTQMYESIRSFCLGSQLKLYGMHFHNIIPITWRTLSLNISKSLAGKPCCVDDYKKSAFPVTGSLNANASCVEKYPVLLYLIHLAVGENGLRRLKKADSKQKGILKHTTDIKTIYKHKCSFKHLLLYNCTHKILGILIR